MKKLLFLTAIAVLTFNSSFAQDEETSNDNGIKFGAKIGGNISTLTDDGNFTPSDKTGFHIGAVINIAISEKDIQKDMNRRRPGQSKFTTQRKESDKIIILSGVFEGKSTGTPISIIIYNFTFMSFQIKFI